DPTFGCNHLPLHTAGRGVPDFQRATEVPRDDPTRVRTPGDAEDGALVLAQGTLDLSRGGVAHPDRAGRVAADELGAVLAPARPGNPRVRHGPALQPGFCIPQGQPVAGGEQRLAVGTPGDGVDVLVRPSLEEMEHLPRIKVPDACRVISR